RGINVMYVDPRYTSQTCSACWQLGKRTKHRFVCPHCAPRAHSDLNASRNLQGLGYQLMTQGLL
ncbi:MAG TPA: transposase, partial [Candidatus Aphodousia faecigallinarum]|nr:transposase [Candidatus Aphodousia faecigallinarum]